MGFCYYTARQFRVSWKKYGKFLIFDFLYFPFNCNPIHSKRLLKMANPSADKMLLRQKLISGINMRWFDSMTNNGYWKLAIDFNDLIKKWLAHLEKWMKMKRKNGENIIQFTSKGNPPTKMLLWKLHCFWKNKVVQLVGPGKRTYCPVVVVWSGFRAQNNFLQPEWCWCGKHIEMSVQAERNLSWETGFE